jgi:proteasome lid subunit RPN8/RPN11
MTLQPFRYFFDLSRREGGAALGQFPAKLDFDPAAEWGRFTALCRWSKPELAAGARIDIQPIWHATSGAPYVEGLRVTARAVRMPAITRDIPASYFQSSALRIGDSLVNQKKLAPGELFNYAVVAYPAAANVGGGALDALDIAEVPVPTPLYPGSLQEELARSVGFGDVDSGLMPVFVPQAVVEEVLAMARQAGGLEVGAILIGKVHRDASAACSKLYSKITAQIPARHVESESARLSFTPDTWASVQAAMELRRAGDQILGWAHNHPGAPHWCNKECAAEAKQQCPFNQPFFSRVDCDLHRVVFSRAYCVALLVTDTFQGLKLTMYGWDRAMIAQRGFHILKPDSARPLGAAEAASIIGTDIYETSCHS